MKLFILISLLLSSSISNSFATDEVITLGDQEIELTVSDRGWITGGSVYPVMDITGHKTFVFEYEFKTDKMNTVKNVIKQINGEASKRCKAYSEEELEASRDTYLGDDRFFYTESVEAKEDLLDTIDFTDSLGYFSTYLRLSCNIKNRIQSKN